MTTTTDQSMNAGVVRGGPLIAGVEVSVKKSESHTLTAQATRVAMESGATVTDHVIQSPDELSLTFAMANTGSGVNAARDAYESFKKMKEEGQLLEVETEHALYTDMVITSISPVHSAPYKGALEFTLNLVKAHTVELAVVGRQPATLAPEVRPVFSPETNAGVVAMAEADRSALETVLDKAAGIAREASDMADSALETVEGVVSMAETAVRETIAKVPLVSQGARLLSVDTGEGILRLRSYLSDGPEKRWLLDIKDAAESAMATGLPLVSGSADILKGMGEQFKDMRLLVANTKEAAIGGVEALGETLNLYFMDKGEKSPFPELDPMDALGERGDESVFR